MKFIPIKTRKFQPPKDDILKELDKRLPKLREGDVLFITSKVLAIHQGRCIKIQDPRHRQGFGGQAKYKNQLIKKEAEGYLVPPKSAPHPYILTIKDYVLIPSAGIDESNGDGYYILWPKNTQRLLKQIWGRLRKKYNLKNFGIVATDSHTIPLRWGTQGISIGFYGFKPLQDFRGQKDLFGRKLKVTQANIVDALSAVAVLRMGEGNEQTPFLILRGASFIKLKTASVRFPRPF